MTAGSDAQALFQFAVGFGDYEFHVNALQSVLCFLLASQKKVL
jgi:hypothetical protein